MAIGNSNQDPHLKGKNANGNMQAADFNKIAAVRAATKKSNLGSGSTNDKQPKAPSGSSRNGMAS